MIPPVDFPRDPRARTASRRFLLTLVGTGVALAVLVRASAVLLVPDDAPRFPTVFGCRSAPERIVTVKVQGDGFFRCDGGERVRLELLEAHLVARREESGTLGIVLIGTESATMEELAVVRAATLRAGVRMAVANDG